MPFLAGAPPTIRLCITFAYPHPSSGVSKRPIGYEVGSFLVPKIEKKRNTMMDLGNNSCGTFTN